MKNGSILVVGSVALDTIRTPFGEVKDVLGGSATYFSLAAHLFSPVRIFGVVGSDFPRVHIRKFRSKKIDISGLKICPGKTFRWTGEYGDNLNEARTISVCPEALSNFSADIPDHYRDSEYVFLANTDPEVQMKVLEQVKTARAVAVDTMNLWIRNKLPELKKLLKKADIMLVNEGEARMLTGRANLLDCSREIQRLGPRIVVIKKGEHGALLAGPDDLFIIPAYPMRRVLDPTGAGDSFGGGFLGYLASCGSLSWSSLRKAAVYGAVVASFTVEGFSTRRLEKITHSDIETRLAGIRQLARF